MANSRANLTKSLRLSPADREAAAAVLQDCVDQLAILGGIMPSHNKPSAVDSVSNITHTHTHHLMIGVPGDG